MLAANLIKRIQYPDWICPSVNAIRSRLFGTLGESPKLGATVSPEEVQRYNELANEWKDPNGSFAPLHKMNPHRMGFVLDYVNKGKGPFPLSGLSILDVGCGGGILSRPLRDAGGNVRGIDTSDETIRVLNTHTDDRNADSSRGEGKLHFEHADIESVVARQEKFDVVVASEVIEHVENPSFFFKMLTRATVDGGTIVVTTINKTPEAYATVIFAAEKVLKLIPEGLHEYAKFVSPETLKKFGQQTGVQYLGQRGLVYLPFVNKFVRDPFCRINYMMAFRAL